MAKLKSKKHFKGKSILVTGGTGSFGRRFCQELIDNYEPERVIVYSRDEFKQSEMASSPAYQHRAMRYFLGDVRDKERLVRAMQGVDIVVHAAALKQVPAAEYNPIEFIKTNINGAVNIVDAALNVGVEKVVALSTDKAVNPINLYGATKLCSDKVFVAANSYRGRKATHFSVVRYGNVLGSRGSVIPLFLEQKKQGKITVTSREMTRFFMTVYQGVRFVLDSIEMMEGGELFIPKIQSSRLGDIVDAIAPECECEVIGVRPGEKMHEVLITADESHLALEFDDHFLIQPVLPFWELPSRMKKGKRVEEGFVYSSYNNDRWFSPEDIRIEAECIAKTLGYDVDWKSEKSS